jgi:molybdopterin-containing oxidoreductase family membrane subunit
MGGLSVLVLDLGRPDRLIVAMTYYNLKSIFAWNIFLYTGFMGVVGVYLWWMMERRMQPYYPKMGLVAFVWRLILTTGTGSIFGFLVSREAYNSAVLAPMFIAMSLSLGLAIFLIVLIASYRWTGRPLGQVLLQRLTQLLGVFVAVVFYFVVAYHLTNLYMTGRHGVEAFVLMYGGVYTMLFWFVQIILGTFLPLFLIYLTPFGKTENGILTISKLVIFGGIAQIYVIIIGGQAYPIETFAGMEVITSSFFDGRAVHPYTPSHWEILLGIGGIAIAMLLTALAMKILPFLPDSLADEEVDPHIAAKKKACC